MPPALVLPVLDPGDDGQARLGFGPPAAPGAFALQSSKETLSHGVVIGVPHSAHRKTHAHLAASISKGNAGVLGRFNWSSQHLTQGGIRWDAQRDGQQNGQDGRQCARRAVLRAINGKPGKRSGNALRRVYRARMRQRSAAYPNPLARAGSAMLGGCHQLHWRPFRGGT